MRQDEAAPADGADAHRLLGSRGGDRGPLFEHFEKETGIEVEVRYGDSAELAATIAEEGDNEPRRRLLRPGRGRARRRGGERPAAAAPRALLDRVPERFRDPDGRWVGTSGRARVVAYNTDALTRGRAAGLDLRLTDPKWKGKIGLPADERLVSGLRDARCA